MNQRCLLEKANKYKNIVGKVQNISYTIALFLPKPLELGFVAHYWGVPGRVHQLFPAPLL